SKLDVVDDQTYLASSGKPKAMMLVSRFVSVTNPIRDDLCMAAKVKNRRRRFRQLFWHIKIRCHIKPGQRLEMEFLHREVVVFEFTGDDRAQIRSFGQRRQPEHFEELDTILLACRLPIFACVNLLQAAVRQFPSLGEVYGRE